MAEYPNADLFGYIEDEIEDCGDDSACDEPRCPSYRKYCADDDCSHDEEIPEWMNETCEHGLSAWLCEDPFNHYGSDR